MNSRLPSLSLRLRTLLSATALLLSLPASGQSAAVAAEPAVEVSSLVYSEVDWAPLSLVDQPVFRGMLADYLDIISQRTGLKFIYQPSDNWAQVLAKFSRGEIDVVPALAKEDKIGAPFLYTEPFLEFPLVIVARDNVDFIAYTHELNGKTVAVGEGYTSYHFLNNNYPDIKLLTVNNVSSGLQLVQDKQIDAFVGHLAVVLYELKKHHHTSLKVVGKTEYNFEHRIGISPQYPKALALIDSALASIDAKEHNSIYNRWVEIEREGFDFSTLRNLMLLLLLVVVVAGERYFHLRRINKQLDILSSTDKLTQLANRTRIDQRLADCEYSAERHHKPFSVILIDIDDFKEINDKHGHNIGDKVLQKFAALLKGHVRQTDLVGRWGGEEFLVVCGDTDLDSAMAMAEKIYQCIDNSTFAGERHITATLSVAQHVEGEHLTSLFDRVDQGLYQGKRSGKNMVVTNPD